MTLDTIVLLSLVVWFVVIPLLVVGLRLRRARIADGTLPPVSVARRACEGRSRLAWTSRARARASRSL
jgi:hypothetical protein